MRIALVPIVACAVGIATVPCSDAHACSCMIAPSAVAAFADSDEVFRGRVTTVQRPYADAMIQSSMDPVIVTLAVERVWKGDLGKTVKITTSSDSASCGFGFVAKERYLVFANERFVSLCSRTKPVAEASDDLRELGLGRAPLDVAEVPTPTPVATPDEDATGYDRCPGGVATVTEPFSGFLDLDHLTGTYDMACDQCTLTRCDVAPREGPIETRYENGQPHIRGFYQHGKREGHWASWHAGGQPHYDGIWRHDRQHGLWRIWWGSGLLQSEMQLTNGLPDGDWLQWYANGNPQMEGHYARGARTGTWRYWEEDGTLRAEGPGGPAH